jgi:hypothetical protein
MFPTIPAIANCLAFIAGLSAYRLPPRATLEIPGGRRRWDRILELIQSCRYSFHNLSRVQLDRKLPVTPRFSMPFELGLTVALQCVEQRDHDWFGFESLPRRLNRSLMLCSNAASATNCG